MTVAAVNLRRPLAVNPVRLTSVKLIGLGGVGSIVARYCSMFLASQPTANRLVLIDGDNFEPSNATRMFFSRHGNKARVVAAELTERFADSNLAVIAVDQFVTSGNISRLIRDGETVLLAVDNHATRKMTVEHCSTLANVALISGGNDGIEQLPDGRSLRGTFGNCQLHIRRAGRDLTPPLTRFHPEIANPADVLPTDKSCTELLASVPQLLFANLATASAMLNAFYLFLCDALPYDEVAFDIAEGLCRPVRLPRG